MRKPIIPDPKTPRPRTITEARQLIRQTFDELGWNDTERKVFFELSGVAGDEKEGDVRRLIEVLGDARMILFEEN